MDWDRCRGAVPSGVERREGWTKPSTGEDGDGMREDEGPERVGRGSTSFSFITDCCLGLMIPTEEVIRVVVDEEGATLTAAVPLGPLMRVVERAKHELRVMCMVVPLRDTNEDDLLDRVEPCLDFIDEGIQFLYPLYEIRIDRSPLRCLNPAPTSYCASRSCCRLEPVAARGVSA
ncbi:hypothetical protein ZEAMMB73_Zm00001d041336 [Zea mays]|uniref:Uncharacterized protein n=1 Tax=Zea mays TaxID=4577 RepID=A0A1D6MVJ6_MAIZE|nr:hypothetical protein ZEAMMB73_Zm00001d041336 [Zea mays]